MIEVKHADKNFQNIHAISNVSVQICDGMIFGLIGSNGAGKSTFLRMIAGIIQPDSGTVSIDGESIFEHPEIKSQICFLSDTPYFFPAADLWTMRRYYETVYPDFNRKMFDSLAKKFHLDQENRIGTFSKGMKKQVSIILGLCTMTRYLLCDETFDGLDPLMRQAVKSLFAAEMMTREFTPVISSHNLRELEDICDNVGLLHKGQMLLSCDLNKIRCSICRLHCVIPDSSREQELIGKLKILKMERSGSLLTLTVRGDREEILKTAESSEPLFAEVLPLTLEEIFISETEVAGYDIKDFIH